jgi:hypothetical protein
MRTLQLDPDQVRTAANFFEAYGSYALSTGGVEEESATGGTVYLLDAASSLRSAGQWAMLFDSRRAARLLARSAQIWDALGYGFGTFVLAAVAPDQLDLDRTSERLLRLAAMYSPPRQEPEVRSDRERQRLPGPLLHPQQQAYLLLAGASLWQSLPMAPDLLRVIVDQSPHRRGVAPVGALGMPLRLYWDMAGRLLDNSDEESVQVVANNLARMCLAYAESINSAMANERLWFNAASPVDVGDIDIVGIALASAHRLGANLMQEHLQSAMGGLDAIARVPMELASEMIDDLFKGPPAQAAVRA